MAKTCQEMLLGLDLEAKNMMATLPPMDLSDFGELGALGLPTAFPKPSCPKMQTNLAFAIISVILVVIGLLGNMVVAFIILVLQEYKKSVANWYILQLALADTLFLLMLPFTASSELSGGWTYGVGMCKLKEAILFINYYASIYFLVVMSFDRYIAVTKAFASSALVSRIRSPEASYVFTVAGWVISILFSVPLFMYSNVHCDVCAYSFPSPPPDCCAIFTGKLYDECKASIHHDINNSTDILTGLSNSGDGNGETIDFNNIFDMFTSMDGLATDDFGPIFDLIPPANMTVAPVVGAISGKQPELCKYKHNSAFFTWVGVNFVLAFCLPLILICFFYGMIIRTIMNSKKVGNNEAQRSYRRRVTMIVLALVFLFVASWLPWHTVHLAKIIGFSMGSGQCSTLSYAVRITAYFSSALNPYLYSFLGARFTQRLTKAKETMRLSTMRYSSRVSTNDSRRRRRHSTSNSVSMRQPQERPLQPQENVYWRGNTADELEIGETRETFVNTGQNRSLNRAKEEQSVI